MLQPRNKRKKMDPFVREVLSLKFEKMRALIYDGFRRKQTVVKGTAGKRSLSGDNLIELTN